MLLLPSNIKDCPRFITFVKVSFVLGLRNKQKKFLGLYARQSSRQDVEGVLKFISYRVGSRVVGPSSGEEQLAFF